MKSLFPLRATALCLAMAACANAGAWELTSADIGNGQHLKAEQVYQGFGCSGANLSPQLEWTAPPAGTKSLAITVYDPDAPTGSGWWHWSVYDLPAATRSLGSGAGRSGQLPAGAKHGRNDYGGYDFGGACPPPGDTAHRYVVTVHALKVDRLEVPADASPALIGFMLNAHRLDSATLTARYGR